MTRNRSWSLRPDPNRYLSPIVDMPIFFSQLAFSLCCSPTHLEVAVHWEPGGSLGVIPFSASDANELQRLGQDSGGPLEGCHREVNFLSVLQSLRMSSTCAL